MNEMITKKLAELENDQEFTAKMQAAKDGQELLALLKEYGIDISKEQAVVFVKALNRYRRKHPEWVLVEVESSNGEYVKVKL